MKRLFVVALIIGVCIFLYRCDQSSRPSQEQIEELIGFDDRDIGYSKDVSVDIVTDNFGVTLGGSSTPYHMILRVRWEPLKDFYILSDGSLDEGRLVFTRVLKKGELMEIYPGYNGFLQRHVHGDPEFTSFKKYAITENQRKNLRLPSYDHHPYFKFLKTPKKDQYIDKKLRGFAMSDPKERWMDAIEKSGYKDIKVTFLPE